MDALVQAAVWFIGLFQEGAKVFVNLVTGIVPVVIVLLTAFNAVITWIGQERIDKIGQAAGKEGFQYTPLRYLILPVVAVFVLTNPMAYTMGRFLPEKYKPAFYDAAVSFVHPPLGIFPHVNPGELFVWAGIAQGVTQGYGAAETASLAVRYLLVGLVVIFIRGLVTERITAFLWARRSS
ncbi:MAG: PTS glucitol/sorbitol transporter subunit IIC [Thermanaerothrix sp.]|uniref:PTS glucitol/sorbitol transporter subunit IIC n=1 Tax=Thermanaerothrix sp. TaxID=2972675 RepID=UPI003C7BD25E